jgi:hypothetical protein
MIKDSDDPRSLRHDSTEPFSSSEERRNTECANKDRLLSRIFRGIRISNPNEFRAILMPCLYGMEVDFLLSRGVPKANMHAIERDKKVFRMMKSKIAKSRGVTMTPKPMPDTEALSYFYALTGPHAFRLIYLDYFSRPGFRHLQALQRIFALRLLAPHSTLILNLGKTRCRVLTKQFSDSFCSKGEELPGKNMIIAAAGSASHPMPKVVDTYGYKSNTRSQVNYTVVVAKFGSVKKIQCLSKY